MNLNRVLSVFPTIFAVAMGGCAIAEDNSAETTAASLPVLTATVQTTQATTEAKPQITPPEGVLVETDETVLAIETVEVTSENTEPRHDNQPVQTMEVAVIGREKIVESGGVSLDIKTKRPSNFNIPKDMQNLVIDYFTSLYSSLGSLSASSLEGFFDMKSQEAVISAVLHDEILNYLIETRSAQENDLSFDKTEILITYTDFFNYNDVYYLDFHIGETVYFGFNPDKPAISSAMEQYVQIVKTDDGYKILNHEEDIDIYNLFTTKLEYSGLNQDTAKKSEVKTVLSEIKSSLVTTAKADISALKASRERYNANPEGYKTTVAADNAYNAKKAVEYSYKWTDSESAVRNPSFGVYDYYGGNCQNFASQCLYAGGIPMDIKGRIELQWKWYGEKTDYSQSKNGRSYSWASTGYFYDYAKYNTGFGLVAELDRNLYSARVGDLIYMFVDDVAYHTVIVTDIVKDSDGNVIDLLINSNTTDKIDFPLSAYPYTDQRLVKIIGWNN